MDKCNLKRKEACSNKINNKNMDKKDTNLNFEFPLEYNSYSDDEIFENTYSNNNINKSKVRKQNKICPKINLKENKILISSDNKNIYNNMHNNLKQTNNNSNINNNYMRKISNNKLNNNNNNNKKTINTNNNKFAKIKNTKKKKDINQIKGKYKSLKHMMENSDNNKMLKEKYNDNNNGEKDYRKNDNNNLYYNKYVKEENKMINYNYFVLNPKNINENKKKENNLIQNIIKYPINKNYNINKNIYIDRVRQKNKIKNKNKDLYIYLRNSFYKENDIEKDDYLTNSQELIYNSINPNVNSDITETMSNQNNKNNLIKNNKGHIRQFSKTFVEIKDIKTIEQKENNEINMDDINQNISKQIKKNGKSYKKKLLNNSVTQNKNKLINNRVKKNDLTIEIFQNKNRINDKLNLNKLNNNNIISSLNNINKEPKTPISYNNSTNNTINNINNNKTIINKNESKLIYKKRKISNHKCQSKIKKPNVKNENDINSHNYFTENKKANILNNFIELSKNVKKVELFKVLTSERKTLKLNTQDNNINNNEDVSKGQKEKKSSYIYTKNFLTKFKKNSKKNYSNSNLDYTYDKNLLLNTKVSNVSSFCKKYNNFFTKRPVNNLYYIEKRIKFRAPVNKLCIFSKNIILKEGYKEGGNNTILELNSSSKFNNTNKNMEILEEIEDNDNEDFNIEEYEKKNKILEENKPRKNIFKIEKGLEKLCRIFFRNLEMKNKKMINKELNCAKNLNLNLKKEKSEPNINLKTKKISGMFSSTIQNWNCIDKKNYKKEDENDNNVPFNNKINKKRKRKKHSLLLNIHKAFSEEKIREQIQTERRSVNLNSRFLLIKNQNDFIINQQATKEINNISNDIINQKDKYINIINDLNKENYTNSLSILFNLISNQNNENTYNYNNFEVVLNNQFTFIEAIVEKSIKVKKEKTDIALLAKLCYDLYVKFISDFIYINKKKAKSENLKSILKSECKQKFDECDIITLLNISNKKFKKEKNLYQKMKCKLLGIIDFISELIKVKMISQKMGLEYLDTLKKRINSFDDDIKNFNDIDNLKDIKNLYFEGELYLLEKISTIIIERKKPKHIQNLKNFIEDNIIPIIINKTINQKLVDKFLVFLNEIKNNDFFKDMKKINEK